MIPTICPGCGLGCGLYLAQDLSFLELRRACPVNSGKLCGFGIKLNQYYSENRVAGPMVNGERADLGSAIQEALRILRSSKPEFICMGNATCEEMLGLAKLAAKLDANPSLGFPGFGRMDLPRFQISLDEIENRNPILSVLDCSAQYPLLARRLIRARAKGSRIIEISFSRSKICDEWYPLSEGIQVIQDLDFKPSLVLMELNPIWDPDWIRYLIQYCSGIHAELFIAKPFLNLDCGLELGFDLELNPADSAYLLEPPRTLPQGLIQHLESMQNLILHTSIQHPLCQKADVVIPNSPFFEREGWVINPEGRILMNRGTHPGGIQIFDELLRELGAQGISLDGLRAELKQRWGLDHPNEYRVQLPPKQPAAEYRVSPAIPRSEFKLCYRTNPFFWNGIQSRDYLELNSLDLSSLGIFKSEIINLKLDGQEFRIKAKPSQIPQGILISEIPLGYPRGLIQRASISRIRYG